MSSPGFGKLIWALIYGGMLAIGIGFALQRTGGTGDVVAFIVGGAAIAAGVVMIWLRSRQPDVD